MISYPVTNKENITDTYFGIDVADPYRWLEDDTAAETVEWVKEQNKITAGYLSAIAYRDKIKARLNTLWNYERYGTPFTAGKYTYFYKNSGLQSQPVLYRQPDGGQAEVFLDPNTFSADGTTSLGSINFSKDGSLAAYQVSEGGSDWRTVIVLNAGTQHPTGDMLNDIKFSEVAWKGNEGFYYSSYDKPETGSQLSAITEQHKLYYHKLGTPQSDDKLIFGGSETPRRYISAYLTEDEQYLVITAAKSTSGNELYIQDLHKPGSAISAVVSNFDNEHHLIDNDGSKLYLFTSLNAPNNKVITVNADNPGPENWKDLIPETQNVLSISTGGGKLFANYLEHAVSVIIQYGMNGEAERTIALPGPGSVSGFNAKKTEKELYYTFTSYVYPPTIFKYRVDSGISEVYRKSGVSFNPDLYESKQVFYTSKDGTQIPMILTYKKGLECNGKNPTVLYGYGGFNISLTPAFSTANIILLEQGGIFAVANLRGGGEYGEKWHIAGTRMQKQNVFDDFIAAAEYLIKNQYTSSDYLAASGGSNGGLLVAAVMIQRPELFKVVLPAVAVLDMLRYHKFTAGAGWAYDYGTAEESPEMFNYLYGYSPYHALKPGVAYPATLITTGDHDDRVVPAHSFKFVARLQEYHNGPAPVLIRIETKAGHGAGKSTEQVIAEQADKWAFLFHAMGLQVADV